MLWLDLKSLAAIAGLAIAIPVALFGTKTIAFRYRTLGVAIAAVVGLIVAGSATMFGSRMQDEIGWAANQSKSGEPRRPAPYYGPDWAAASIGGTAGAALAAATVAFFTKQSKPT